MKKIKNLQSLSLQKIAIARFSTAQIKGGQVTTTKSNVTCGGLCANTALNCMK
jgi:hypothetical protein